MRITILAAAFAVAVPTVAAAQGWELLAGLSRVSASVCTDDGACFGIECTADRGWSTGWTAIFPPTGDAAVPDPILAIRMNGSRFALTSLASDGAAGRYRATIAEQDQGLLEALQRNDAVVVDPGRDFAVADFTLRGSRWAIGEALDLCESGGPDVFLPAEGEAATE